MFKEIIRILLNYFITIIIPKPKIIKQIEQEIGVKLSKYEEVEWNRAYRINWQQRVIELSLYRCELKCIPQSLIDLIYLQKLYLNHNKIEKLPEPFGQLQNLMELGLKSNQLKELPASFGQLQNLEELRLEGNQLKELPASFGQLQNLCSLFLRQNQLKELPTSFGQLQNLRSLFLQQNQLKELPTSFGQLQNLRSLFLEKNQLQELPTSFGQLQNLNYLNLENNQLQKLPTSFGQLQNLHILNLYKNQLQELPASFGKLKGLGTLELESNQLKELPASFGQLQNLRELRLGNNQLKELPASFGELKNSCKLSIFNNPLENSPLEIANRGIESIRNYFEQLKQGDGTIYEAKVLILGEGGAGKTSLANKILDASYKLKPEEKSTQGIDILKYQFPIDDKQFTAHIWDFGGQEIYHATHQFFLTKRSLYVLVADTRKEDARFEYWLQIVELLADDSPIIIVKNEKQDRLCEINEPRLKGRFEQLKHIESTNLKTNRNLESILEQLQIELKKLPHVGQILPKTWVDVRLALENDKRNYISLNEFLNICEQHGFKRREDKLQLSGYLHDLGTCLHFQNDPLLNKTVILKPEWGTDAVYKVLDNQHVKNNQGRFNKNDLSDIWQAAEYENMHDELLQLMMNFKLCYKLDYCDIYIAPQILPTKQPEYDWNEKDNTVLRYEYEFMPKGMMTQFIVAMHKNIEDKQQRVWKEGVVLQKDKTRAEITEEYEKRQIHIRIQGKNRRELATIVLHEWDKIHDSYYNLKVDTLIPCNCSECFNKLEPYFHIYSELLNLKNKSNVSQCKRSGEMVDIQKLLGEVLSHYKQQNKNVHINIMQTDDMNHVNANQGDNVQQQLAQQLSNMTPEQQAKVLEMLKNAN